MNTPAKIARMLGWPEAQRPPVVVTRPGSPPRLRVWQHRVYGDWWWRVGPHGDRSERGVASSHAEALAVGLAALETASMRTRT